MARPKKPKHDFSRLTQDQMIFIQNKVVELGSYEAVEKFYSKDDTVSEFARTVARGLYGKTNQ